MELRLIQIHLLVDPFASVRPVQGPDHLDTAGETCDDVYRPLHDIIDDCTGNTTLVDNSESNGAAACVSDADQRHPGRRLPCLPIVLAGELALVRQLEAKVVPIRVRLPLSSSSPRQLAFHVG